MSRRYNRRNPRFDARILLLLTALALVVIFIHAVIVLSLIAATLFLVFKISGWAQRRMLLYENNFALLWSAELKWIFRRLIAIACILWGILLLFSAFWPGVGLTGMGLILYPMRVRNNNLQSALLSKRARRLLLGGFLLLVLVTTGPGTTVTPVGRPADKLAEHGVSRQQDRGRILTDSLIARAKKHVAGKQYRQALLLTDSVLKMFPGDTAAGLVAAKAYHQLGKYRQAIEVIGTMPFISADARMIRAKSFIRSGDRKAALPDLRQLMIEGDVASEQLYNKVNPLVRRIVGYVIRCCDGSISYSQSRRGTCSHHGGVCDWSEPEYEESRKYGE